MKKRKLLIFLFISVVIIEGVYLYFSFLQKKETGARAFEEQDVTLIPLSGPLTKKRAEVSGLAWFGDNLIFLPQYPDFVKDSGDGFLFYLPKDEILAYLDGTSRAELEPRPIPLTAVGLAHLVHGYQGLESIGFSGTRVFLTIEAGKKNNMQGYLISGVIAPDLSGITLDTTKLALISPQANYENRSDESILVFDDKVVTFYEANGKGIVAEPVAHVFDFDLNPLGTIPMPNLEYRLTDTALSSEDEFWGINYFPPSNDELIPTSDPISSMYGIGKSHTQYPQVERLVKFIFSEDGITLADSAPIPFVLTEDARNWEGLAILDDRGFLLVTDDHPDTLFGFVPLP
ncbi:MAG: hypothetical protein IH588_11690 [Anaerolineales bacterium]|nr:hypothetical protein [Anaerolineales bacterium]